MDIVALLIVAAGVAGYFFCILWLLRRFWSEAATGTRVGLALFITAMTTALAFIWVTHEYGAGAGGSVQERAPVAPIDRPSSSGPVGHLWGMPAFPWPPPTPSASIVIPREILIDGPGPSGPLSLWGVDRRLRSSLAHAGYYQVAYYAAPRGFGLVARLERINQDGSPVPGAARFDPSFRPLENFSAVAYLRALFLAPPGYYRVIAFIVSPVPFASTGTPIRSSEADAWLERGENFLPPQIAGLPYSDDYVCTALIYEFEKHDAGSDPIERHPGRLSADIHLARAKIAEGLSWRFR